MRTLILLFIFSIVASAGCAQENNLILWSAYAKKEAGTIHIYITKSPREDLHAAKSQIALQVKKGLLERKWSLAKATQEPIACLVIDDTLGRPVVRLWSKKGEVRFLLIDEFTEGEINQEIEDGLKEVIRSYRGFGPI